MVTIHSPWRPLGGQPADHGLDVDDGTATRERRIDELQPLAIEMGVRVDEARDDARAGEIDDPGSPSLPAADVRSAADRDDAAAGDGEGRRGGPARNRA